MSDILGYKNFCSSCKGSKEENGGLVCGDKNGRFYGLPVKQVLMAPCMKRKKEFAQNANTVNQKEVVR